MRVATARFERVERSPRRAAPERHDGGPLRAREGHVLAPRRPLREAPCARQRLPRRHLRSQEEAAARGPVTLIELELSEGESLCDAKKRFLWSKT